MADAFQPKFVDLVRNTTSTQGTGNFVLGPAATGFTSFTAALQPGDSFYYSAIGVDKPAEREVGRGTLLGNGNIARSPIGGPPTNFSNGTKTIALIAAAEWYGAAQQLVGLASRFPAVLSDRAALAGYAATTTAYLSEAAREGMFVWDGSDRSAAVAADPGQGLYVAAASDSTGKSGAWVRKFSGAVSVKWFGALGDGAANDGAAFAAALTALKAFADNPSSGGFYKGSPRLFIPAGHYFLGNTPLDVSHTVIIEGEGSGRFGPGGGGCSRLRWAAGTSGIRIQFPTTSGDRIVDSTTHDGSGGVLLRQLMIEGGYAGAEGDFHALVCRKQVTGDDLYIKNWQGEGIKGWAGNVIGFGNVGGDFSVSCFKSVRIEGCRIGSDVRGSDANLVTFINCEGYQNRQAGFVDDNGAGSNTYMGCHAASNGLISGATPTQCTQSGNHYALTWTGNPTNPPSGTTDDTADWRYIEPGAADSTRPAWTSAPGTFRPGGDYVTLNSAGVVFYNCYSEGGGFSHFLANTRVDEGTIGDPYSRGGIRTNSRPDGWRVRQHPNATMLLEHRSTQAALIAQDEFAVPHSMIVLSKTIGNDHFARDASGHRFFTAPYKGTWTLRGAITTSGLELPAGASIFNNGQQVVGARQTGTPADAIDLATALTLVNALKAKLIAHGLIA
jgi:hypothetical protein